MLGWIKSGRNARDERGFLQRLRTDTRGNTIAIMAASLIPMIGLLGGALDMSRLYLAKTRLQQACDAGALAGRKVMGSGQWSANGGAANMTAREFFVGNFKDKAYGTTNLTYNFSEAAGRVTGTASVTVPMTLMQVFRINSQTLTVTCDAEMRLPNTDVMFVLDTTGSMNETLPGDTQTKISALRFAVKCFYEIVAKYDTNANCGGTAPSGGTGNSVQIRFGFVPYATNVNVGKSLKPEWMANSWSYQTRVANWNTTTESNWGATVDTTGASGSGTSPTSTTENVGLQGLLCPSVTGQTNVPGSFSYDTTPVVSGNVRTWETRTYTRVNITYTSVRAFEGWTYVCFRKVTTGTGSYTTVRHEQRLETTTSRTFQNWNYGFLPQDVSGLKGPDGWNSSIQLEVANMNVGDSPALATIGWDGCIEERKTVRQSSYWPLPAGAKDLDIDLVPTASDPDSLWGPALPNLIWGRQDSSGNRTRSARNNRTENYPRDRTYACPSKEAQKLGTMTASQIEGYVDTISPGGNTYHDIGIIWGGRLLSPTGIFRSENEFTPRGGEIERHMIFMTDGETCTDNLNYTAYGVAWYDQRHTTATTDGCDDESSDGGELSQQVNKRFAAVCEAIKQKNITLWVVYFGSTDADTRTRMTNCATSGRFFNATNSATLLSTFQSIANQISQLRLTR